MKKMSVLIFIALLFYTRFIGLDWGLPYPMHPDERNMANAVQGMSCNFEFKISNLKLNECLNPHFFAYGQFPLYLAYGGIAFSHTVTHTTTPITFDEATLALRTLSALASILLVFVLYKTVFLLIENKKEGLLRLGIFIFLIFSPFAIQFAHFGTTESFLMLFYSSILYFCLLLLKNKMSTTKFVVITGILSGLSLGTKTSSALFLGLPIMIMCYQCFFYDLGSPKGGVPAGDKKNFGNKKIVPCLLFFGYFLLFCCMVLIFTVLSSPQSFINWNDFVSSMNYESSIGMGSYVAFYTRQFVNTTPLIFQIKSILPYALGWPQFILGTLGFFLLPFKSKRRKGYMNENNILRLALLFVFLPNAFFFAKWTRFIAPAFPLFSLLAILFLYQIFKLKKPLFVLITLISIIPGIAYLSIYRAPDIRFTASDWIYKNIASHSRILSETANVIDLPIPANPSSNPQNRYYQIASFNFYDLDANSELQKELPLLIKSADYIIIPSRRIFKNHPKETYPLLNNYYEELLSEQSGFEKVAEFASYPKITFFGKIIFELPDENAEETWTVFDHPVIRIYKRIAAQSQITKTDFSNYKTTNYQLLTNNYRLLVADTEEKWEKGLMYVRNKQDIQGFDGMLFVFPDSQTRMFWNKNTLSDLTLYWIEKGKVIGTSNMPSITKTGIVSTFSSPGPADSVIEIIK